MSCVHPVAILRAVFCTICSLSMFVSDALGDHMVEAYSNTGLVMALYVASNKYWFQRLPPARGGTAQKKIIHLANWSQLIHPGPASSLTKVFLVSSQSCVSTLTHYSSELLLPRHQGL